MKFIISGDEATMRTAIDFLIEWTEGINWKTYLLNIILQNKDIEIDIITNEIIDILVNKKDIIPIVSLSPQSKQIKLHINEIKNPININALSTDASCKLGKNLNVFYGENGSGKSSYVKIFRKLADNFCTSEKNLNVMSNIYTKTKTPCIQSITVCYSCDDNDTCDQCVDINTRHDELSKINVFDSTSVTPLLNTDLTFSVLPKGLKYFSLLTDIIDLVKVNIQEKVSDLQIKQNEIFIDTSYTIITEDITIITMKVKNVGKLNAFLSDNYKLPDDVETQIISIDNRIKKLQGTDFVNLIKVLSTQKRKLTSIKNGFTLLSSKVNVDNISKINKLLDQYDELLEKEKKCDEDFSNKVNHITNVNEEWTNFITSAREYYKSIGISLPQRNSQCIFCGQALSEEHIKLIKACFNHIDSETIKSKNAIDKKIQAFSLPEIAITLSEEDEKLFSEDKKIFIGKLKTTISLVDENKEIFKNSIDNKQTVENECVINFKVIMADIKKEIDDIAVRLANLGKTNIEVNEIVTNLVSQKNEFLKRKKIHASIESFEKWYGYKTQIDYLNKVKSKFNTISLTRKSKNAFKEIVAGDYTATFDKYCNDLGAPNVNIKLSPQKGLTKRSKYVINENVKITDIMSEGEQKAIALAEFLTDLKIRNNYCTTLFDDPVTSFDYKRAEKIADIIYDISKKRQVIVFTHNIMFYYYLYNCCNKKNIDDKFFNINEYNRDNKGMISENFSGKLETLRTIVGKIKNLKTKIDSRKCLGNDLELKLQIAYSRIRAWCELIVEEGFFKGMIRRFEPDIKFGAFAKIDAEFVTYIPSVTALFNKCCRYIESHSQPYETQNIKPSREEFNKDFAFVLELFNKYKN